MRLLVAALVFFASQARAGDFTVLLGGDVALPTGPNDVALDALGPRVFEHVTPWITGADIAFANLEAPLTERDAVVKKTFPMTMPPARLAWVLAAGFDIFSLANNHVADAGHAGVIDTIEALATRGVGYVGAGRSAEHAATEKCLVANGTSVCFLAFGNGSAPEVAHFDAAAEVHRMVFATSQMADVVIVSVHGGTEYRHAPEAELTRLYRMLIDAGADVVVATHPHVIRGIEHYKEGLILHGVGNLAFGTITDRHRQKGATLWGMLPLVHFSDKRVDHLQIVPLWVDNGYALELPGEPPFPAAALQPRPLSGAYAQAMLDALTALTKVTDPTLTIVRKGDEGFIYLYGPRP